MRVRMWYEDHGGRVYTNPSGLVYTDHRDRKCSVHLQVRMYKTACVRAQRSARVHRAVQARFVRLDTIGYGSHILMSR